MNKHIINIITNRDMNFSLFENIMMYLQKKKDEIDIFDIAEIIKQDKTFLNILYHECKDKKLLRERSNIEIKLTDVFKGVKK